MRFEPELERFEGVIDIDWSRLDCGGIMRVIREEYLALYDVAGEIFTYYPADILTLLSDIGIARDCVREGRSERLTMSGYSILTVKCSDDCVSFSDPVSEDVPLIALSRDAVLAELDSALNSVWHVIQRRVPEPYH